jgi:hypothetical protein
LSGKTAIDFGVKRSLAEYCQYLQSEYAQGAVTLSISQTDRKKRS